MRKLAIILIFLFVLTGCQPITSETVLPMGAPTVERVTAPENNTYKIGQMNYQVSLNENISADNALQYKLDDKYFALKPAAVKIDGVTVKSIRSTTAKIDPKRYTYDGIFGTGFDLDMNFGDRIWNKVMKIDRLNRLALASQAQNVEIWFEMNTNFTVDGWDRQSYFEINDKVRLGDYSYLEPAYVWDSAQIETCEEICESSCDPECLSDADGCDFCDPCEQVCETNNRRQKIKSYLTTQDGKFYYVKQIPVAWLKTAQFPVYTDADVTYGTSKAMLFGGTAYNTDVVALDTDKFVFCYTNNTTQLICEVCTVSGSTIATSSQSTIVNDTFETTFQATKIDTDKFVVCYNDDALDDDGYVKTSSVSGTTITPGTATEFFNGDAEFIGCGTLETNKIAAAYNNEDDTEDGYAVVCTNSGTSLTCGTPSEFATGVTFIKYSTVIGLNDSDGNTFVIVYEDDGNTAIEAIVATTTGTTISSWGAVKTLQDADTFYIGGDILQQNTFVAAWSDNTANIGNSVIGTVDGSYNISTGSLATFGTAGASEPGWKDLTSIDSTRFVVSFEDRSNSEYGTSVYGSVSGNVITFGSNEVFFSTQSIYITSALISENKIVICYDDDALDDPFCIIGTTSATPSSVQSINPPIQIITF